MVVGGCEFVYSPSLMKEYFSHDYNARTDEKIVKLISKMGWQGYGLFWAIIEKLYEADGYIDEDYDCIAFDLRTECERIKSIINDFGLFVLHQKKISSKSVLHRLRLRKGKSEKARQSALFRWQTKDTKHANAMRTQCEGNAIKVNKSKVNKSKEIGEKILTPSQIAKDFFQKGDYYQKAYDYFLNCNIDVSTITAEFDKFIDYWTEPNRGGTKVRWETEKTFEVSRRLKTWFRNIKQFSPPKKERGGLNIS